jgi:hypothetical protein
VKVGCGRQGPVWLLHFGGSCVDALLAAALMVPTWSQAGRHAALTGDVVVQHICDHLVANGWEILSLAMPNKRGTERAPMRSTKARINPGVIAAAKATSNKRCTTANEH